MIRASVEQIRNFRLRAHHLDAEYQKTDVAKLVGACGMQNSPPRAWETALHNRVPDCSVAEMEYLLYKEKSLVQAWSFRGAPVVFPTLESDIFLSALLPEGDEPWIYTQGIRLALDYLQMSFAELFDLLMQVITRLDEEIIVSKTSLDQTLAEWMLPLLSVEKRKLWNQPSMYGRPDKQTVGGAVVSFMLRPCAFNGLVVFGERNGISPTFTSYKTWIGHPIEADGEAAKKLARKYLHGYGPTTVDSLVDWLGCSKIQGRRLWDTVSEEIEPVEVLGKKAFFLSADKEPLLAPFSIQRDLRLLGGHDPFLDQRDRIVLQPDKSLHKHIWKLVTNPGAILYRGEVIGIWTSKKKSNGMEIKMTLWADFHEKQKLCNLAEEYAAFRQQKLICAEV